MLHCRVGQITEVADHPNADALYVEQIDFGDGKPRQVMSLSARVAQELNHLYEPGMQKACFFKRRFQFELKFKCEVTRSGLS